MEGGLLDDVVVRESAAALELLTGEDEALLVRGDAFIFLNLGLDVVDCVGGFDVVDGDCLAGERLDEYPEVRVLPLLLESDRYIDDSFVQLPAVESLGVRRESEVDAIQPRQLSVLVEGVIGTNPSSERRLFTMSRIPLGSPLTRPAATSAAIVPAASPDLILALH